MFRTLVAMAANFNNYEAFHEKLARSKRILAVCGAGLSAASGLPTFRGAGGLWRNHKATSLATPEAFKENPGLVWLFYAYRRHMALKAKPNAGHYALAELARKKPEFLCLSQNVDNLHPRAGHPPSQLRLLHGSLFTLKCSRFEEGCTWTEEGNLSDPLWPVLEAASHDVADPSQTLPLLDPTKELAHIPASEIPKCPSCEEGLQRPGVVWFGEALDEPMLDEIDNWIERDSVDLVLVIGTSSAVWPAAGYAEVARDKGASVVTVNLESDMKRVLKDMAEGDFAFAGDAAEVLPRLLEPVIGKMKDDGTFE